MTNKEKKERVFAFFEIFGDDDQPTKKESENSTEGKEPWKMVEELLRFIDIAWHTGNFVGKISIILLVGWPIFLAYFAALGGGTTITAIFALMPFLTAVMMLSTFPVIDAAVLANGKGRRIFKWIMAIIGVELAIGIYFSLIPVSNDAGLVPALVLVLAAILVISLSGKLKRVRTILWIILIGLTIVFVKGGREKAFPDHPDAPQNTQQSQSQGLSGHELKNGYLVEKPSIPTQPLVAADTFKKISSGGSYIEIETNCTDFLHNIVPVNPGEKVKIMHINMDPGVRRNRCTYNLSGSAAPISGSAPGEETLPWFKENMPYPDLPAYALVFILTDSRGNIIARDYIKGNGQFIIFQNTGDDEAIVHADYNYPKQFLNQVGRLGDTVTVSLAVYN